MNYSQGNHQFDWGGLLGGAVQGLASGGVVGAVAGAVTGGLGGGTAQGKGVLIGGTVTQTGGGRITIKTTKGNMVTIKRAKHRRYGYRRSGGGMNAMLKQAMQYKMLSQAMK